MLEILAGFAGSSGLGAIVGTVGSWLNKREDMKMRKLEFQHDIKKAQLMMEESKLEHSHALDLADKNIQHAQMEGDIERDLKEADAFAESIKQGFKNTGIAIVDGIRGIMRPFITAYLLFIATYLAYRVSVLVGGLEAMPIEDLFTLYSSIINNLMFLTMVAVTWWFGTRPHCKQAR